MTNLDTVQLENLYDVLSENEQDYNTGALTALCTINGLYDGIKDYCYWAYGESVENIYSDYFGEEN